MQLERDYRGTLRRVLIERCQRNPKYSLRAFARDLDMIPARLSDILNGKKGLSREAAVKLAKAIGLGTREAEIFGDQAESLHGRNRTSRAQAETRVEAHFQAAETNQDLTLDTFRAVSDWHHFALLQLLKLPRAQKAPEWAAKALGIPVVQVTEALSRLERLELVERKGGKLVPTKDYVMSPDGIPSEAIRKFHEQVLQKAVVALHTDPVDGKDFLTALLPGSAADMPKIKERIRKFNRSLCDEFSYNPKADRVFGFAIQFFDVTPNLKEMKP